MLINKYETLLHDFIHFWNAEIIPVLLSYEPFMWDKYNVGKLAIEVDVNMTKCSWLTLVVTHPNLTHSIKKIIAS